MIYPHVLVGFHDLLDAGQGELVVLEEVWLFRHVDDFLLDVVHLLQQLLVRAVGLVLLVRLFHARRHVSLEGLFQFCSRLLGAHFTNCRQFIIFCLGLESK